LLQPVITYYEASGIGAATDSPLGSSANYTVNNTTDELLNPNDGAPPIVSFPAAGTTELTLPPGQYFVELEITFLTASGNVPSITSVTGSNVSISYQNQGLTADALGFAFVISVYKQQGQVEWTFSTQPTVGFTSDLTITSSWAKPSTLATPAPGYPIDGGLIREYCPVSMSCYTNFVAAPITVNGKIGACLLAPNVCDNDVFTSQPRFAAGNPLYVESLRNFPGNYTGAAKDGAYCIYVPSGLDDMEMRTPSANRDHSFPCICVSFQISDSGNTSANLLVFQVVVVTTYMFYTDVKYFPLYKSFGSVDCSEQALRLLMTFPRASANGKHWDNIKNFLQRSFNFISSNKDVLLPAAKLLGTTALALL